MGQCFIRQITRSGGSSPAPTIVSWQNGTDAEIAAMIAAADAGQIDLTDYWSIDDERTVHLDAMTAGDSFTTAMAAQDVVLVLMDTGTASGYKDVNDNTVNFVVGQKDGLSEFGLINTTDTNAGSWDICAMRTDLNNKYYNALPVTFKGCLKQFKTITATEHNASTLTTSNDYIALFAEKEIFGSSTYCNTTEANALMQVNYYMTHNKLKYIGTSRYYWAERSPVLGESGRFCYVDNKGEPYRARASYNGLISPFMCI